MFSETIENIEEQLKYVEAYNSLAHMTKERDAYFSNLRLFEQTSAETTELEKTWRLQQQCIEELLKQVDKIKKSKPQLVEQLTEVLIKTRFFLENPNTINTYHKFCDTIRMNSDPKLQTLGLVLLGLSLPTLIAIVVVMNLVTLGPLARPVAVASGLLMGGLLLSGWVILNYNPLRSLHFLTLKLANITS